MKRSPKSQKEKGNRSRNKTSSIYAPETVRVSYIQCYLISLIEDAKCIFPGRYSNADATLDIMRIKSRMRAEGSGFATKTLPTLMSGLLDLLEHGSASFPQFKLKRGTVHPAFLGRLFHLAINSVDQDTRVKATDFLYSFSVAFKKLKGEYPVSVIRKLFADFVQTDVELGKIDLHSKRLRPILEDARAQWRIFAAKTGLAELIEESTPQPGPGATNSPTEKCMRYRPHTFYKQIDDVMDYNEWFFPNPLYVFQSDFAYDKVYNCRIESPTARFKAVPKTVGKPRGICIEESEMQTMQQAVRKAFYKAITAYFGDNIALRKQSVNASIALASSVSRTHATIDESEASDRVLRELVEYMSQDNSKICKLLLGLSTRYVIPPEELKDEYTGPIETKKYAPMGSALCFPVMSLVHMFLIKAIIRLSTTQCTKLACEQVFVYGDDIILPVEFVQPVYDLLPEFGMKINTGKSFYKSYFRESCGVHALHGVDITPVYVKYIPYHHSPDAQASVFAIEEQLNKKGLFHTAEFQRSAIKAQWGIYPEVPSGLSLAGYARPYSDVLLEEFKAKHRRKWNKNLQCHNYVLTRFKKRSEKVVITDDLDAYTRWMWERHEDSKTVSDTYGALTSVTRTVPESAIGPQSYPDHVDSLLKRFPMAYGRYTHSTRFGRSTRFIATAGERVYT